MLCLSGSGNSTLVSKTHVRHVSTAEHCGQKNWANSTYKKRLPFTLKAAQRKALRRVFIGEDLIAVLKILIFLLYVLLIGLRWPELALQGSLFRRCMQSIIRIKREDIFYGDFSVRLGGKIYFFKKKYRAESITSYTRQLKRRWTNNDFNMDSLKSAKITIIVQHKRIFSVFCWRMPVSVFIAFAVNLKLRRLLYATTSKIWIFFPLGLCR